MLRATAIIGCEDPIVALFDTRLHNELKVHIGSFPLRKIIS